MRLSAVIALALLLYSAHSRRACPDPRSGRNNSSHQRATIAGEPRKTERIWPQSRWRRYAAGDTPRVNSPLANTSGRMKQAGLEVRTDAGGNLLGWRTGTAKLPVLLFGSHIDSILKGGNFDCDVGSLSAVEVVRALNENGVTTRHPLEVVVWTTKKAIISASAQWARELPRAYLGQKYSHEKTSKVSRLRIGFLPSISRPPESRPSLHSKPAGTPC